jgi:hypothetical protein
MTDEDIDPDFAQSRKGVFAFRLFLHFARTGRMTMAESTGRDYDSVFEEQVAKLFRSAAIKSRARLASQGSSSISLSPTQSCQGAICSASNATARPITMRARPANATGFANRSSRVTAGRSIGFGAPIGFTVPTSN